MVSVLAAVGGAAGNRIGGPLAPWTLAFCALVFLAALGTFVLESGARAGGQEPVRSGRPPLRADPFQDRPAVRARLSAALARQGVTVVLTGNGGTGKTQLAAAAFRQAAARMDVAVWVSATSRGAIIEAFASAADTVLQRRGQPRLPERDASDFLTWLETTKKRWIVVLDDVADPADVRGLWPAGRRGRVLVTTRLRDASMTGHGRVSLEVDVLSHAEARALLGALLSGRPQPSVLDEADALTEDLGCLPLALAQAATVIADRALTCAQYRAELADTSRRLAELFGPAAEDYSRTIASTWALATEHANRRPPAGLALPAVRLAAVTDPNGCPSEVFLTTAARTYLAATQTSLGALPPPPPDRDRAWATVRTLHAFNLLTCDPSAPDRSVRMHALTQRATLEPLTAPELDHVVTAAADAIAEASQHGSRDRALHTAILANASELSRRHPAPLWDTAHPVLILTGRSLAETGQTTAAWEYFTRYLDRATARHGPDHRDVLTARFFLAASSGRLTGDAEAASAFEALLADQTRILGPDHPDTLRTRHNLAFFRGRLGHPEATIAQTAEVVTARTRILGPDHPDTLLSRLQLLSWRAAHASAGAPGGTAEEDSGDPADDAVLSDYQRLLADCTHALGPRHWHTLRATEGVLDARARHGQADPGAERQLIAGYTATMGAEHPETLRARHDSAYRLGITGDAAAAAAGTASVLADRIRVLGPDDPDTLLSRQQLACWRGEADDLQGAITALQALIPDLDRVLGPAHPRTISARWRLIDRRGQAADTDPATAVHELEDLLQTSEQTLGPDHQTTRDIHDAINDWKARSTAI